MALLNHSKKELSAKIVYYGPGLSGKTTNLEWIHRKMSPDKRGKLISLETKTDRTLFFDFLPVQIGEIAGFRTRFNVYTVPGQIFYNETRRMVLKGVDGIVFVADSQKEMANENLENLKNLAENLRSIGKELTKIPLVMQFNKRDLPNILSLEEMNRLLNAPGLPVFEAVAIKGEGVLTTLTRITRVVADHLKQTLFDGSAAEAPAGRLHALPSPEARHEPPRPFQNAADPTSDAVAPAFLTRQTQAAASAQQKPSQVFYHDNVVTDRFEMFSNEKTPTKSPQPPLAAVRAPAPPPPRTDDIPSLGDIGEPPEFKTQQESVRTHGFAQPRASSAAALREETKVPKDAMAAPGGVSPVERVVPLHRPPAAEMTAHRPVSAPSSSETASNAYWVDPSIVTVAMEPVPAPDAQKGIALRFGEPERESGNQVRIPVALRLEATNEILSFHMVIRVEQETKTPSRGA
jgi:hypothetical protein